MSIPVLMLWLAVIVLGISHIEHLRWHQKNERE